MWIAELQQDKHLWSFTDHLPSNVVMYCTPSTGFTPVSDAAHPKKIKLFVCAKYTCKRNICVWRLLLMYSIQFSRAHVKYLSPAHCFLRSHRSFLASKDLFISILIQLLIPTWKSQVLFFCRCHFRSTLEFRVSYQFYIFVCAQYLSKNVNNQLWVVWH